MTGKIPKIDSSPTLISTYSSQPTVFAQSSDLATNSLVTSAAGPTFTTLASQNASSPLSAGSRSNLYLQAALKVSSEIDTLVELGKMGGTTQVTKEQTRVYILEKINTLRENAKNAYNLPSIRSDLCKLSRISSTHYPDLKEEVFNLLIRLIEEDPVAPYTAHGILEIVIDLNSDLVLLNVQTLAIVFQKKTR